MTFYSFKKKVSCAKKKDLSGQSCRTSRLPLNTVGEDLAILPRRSVSIPSPPGIGLVPIPTLGVNDWINAPTAALQINRPKSAHRQHVESVEASPPLRCVWLRQRQEDVLSGKRAAARLPWRRQSLRSDTAAAASVRAL